jgi:recombination protein RecR
MDPVQKLTEYFLKFPGIGRRQARRFVYHLLSKDQKYLSGFADLIAEIKKEILECSSCHRFFSSKIPKGELCDICKDETTDTGTIMVVEKDFDLESVRKSGAYSGRYFVLGGTVPFLDKNPNEFIRAKALSGEIEKSGKAKTLKEIILALSANPEGEHTVLYVKKILEPLAEKYHFKISVLGRGLSTGTELEYSDSDTLRNAFKNRG